MAKKENPKPKEKDYREPVTDEKGVITYDLKPHDVCMIVKWEINFGTAKSTNE